MKKGCGKGIGRLTLERQIGGKVFGEKLWQECSLINSKVKGEMGKKINNRKKSKRSLVAYCAEAIRRGVLKMNKKQKTIFFNENGRQFERKRDKDKYWGV